MVLVLDKEMNQNRATVTHVIHSGGFYGAERMLMDHCLETERYINNAVVLITPPQELLKRFEESGIACFTCSSFGDLIHLTKNKKTIINAHNFKAQIYSWVAARKNKLPLIFTQHGFTPRSIKQRFYMWVSILLCITPTVRHVVCVSKSIALLHRKFFISKNKIEVIANGLPYKEVQKENSGQITIGFIGRLSMEKGPDLFLETIIPLAKDNVDIQAFVLGDGPMYDTLKNTIASNNLTEQIHLKGYQENINSWIKKLSILVISSRTEGTPMVLLEAMQAGIPVVAFSVGGIPDVIVNGKSGLTAQPLNTQELRSNIERLLENSALYQNIVNTAKERQLAHYDLRNNAKQWFAVYTSTLENFA